MSKSSPLDILQQPANARKIIKTLSRSKAPENEARDALLDYVSSWRRTWTLSQWNEELKKLDSCEQTVESWLQTYWLD